MIRNHGFIQSEATRMSAGGFEMTSVWGSSCAKPLFIERGFFV
jgi:hypothetical protein